MILLRVGQSTYRVQHSRYPNNSMNIQELSSILCRNVRSICTKSAKKICRGIVRTVTFGQLECTWSRRAHVVYLFLKRFYNRGNNETNLYLHFRWYQSGWEGSGFSWNVNPPLRYLFSNRLPRRAKQVFSAFVFFSFHLCQFLCYMFPDPWAKKHLALICAYRKKWVSSRYLTQNNFSLRHTHDLTENFLANFVILPINRRENKNCS